MRLEADFAQVEARLAAHVENHIDAVAAFDRLRAQGFRIAVAGITLPNPASIGLHESMRFEPIGALRDIGWKEDGWRDVGFWQLYLQPLGEGTPNPPSAPGPTA